MKSLSHLLCEHKFSGGVQNKVQICGIEDAKMFYCYRLEPVC